MDTNDLKIIDKFLLQSTTKKVFREEIKNRILKATSDAIDKEFEVMFRDPKNSNHAMNRLLERGVK